MVKANYRAWNIDTDEFSEASSTADKLTFFAKYAILAPSGHNSQPWEIRVNKDSLFVSINPTRHLSEDGSGLLSVEPYISLGTFIETYVLAARAYGYGVSVVLFPDTNSVAKISLAGRVKRVSGYSQDILNRVSNRNPFKKDLVPEDTLKKLATNGLSGVKITILSERNDIEYMAKATERAITEIMANPHYRAELSGWVRHNFTRKYEGMPGFTHGFGNAMSLVSKTAVKHSKNSGPMAKHSKHLVLESSALVIVRCTDNKKESFVNAGRIYSRVCIEAQHQGFASSALGASVVDPKTRKEVCEKFNMQDRPIYVLRLGKATVDAPHSPRHPISNVVR